MKLQSRLGHEAEGVSLMLGRGRVESLPKLPHLRPTCQCHGRGSNQSGTLRIK